VSFALQGVLPGEGLAFVEGVCDGHFVVVDFDGGDGGVEEDFESFDSQFAVVAGEGGVAFEDESFFCFCDFVFGVGFAEVGLIVDIAEGVEFTGSIGSDDGAWGSCSLFPFALFS
jgi:hypothetical protein